MINLFETKNENIQILSNDDEITFDLSLKGEEIIYVDWSKFHHKKVIINFHNAISYKVVEINNPDSIDVIINLDDYTSLEHSIASFNQSKKNNYVVNLQNSSFYRGGFADFSFGEKMMNFVCNLNKPYAKAIWNLASLATTNDNKTFYVSFHHYAPHTYAKMENYGVSENESTMNFFGTSSIEKGAKSSATHQSAKIMVFDSKCKCKASPILCIDENDVEASHAAVVGQINEEHIFYLTSRGINEEDAKKLITLGYLNPILKFFTDEEILNKISKNIEGRF
ncbi:MAG: SufD family Fe-S cluster assembly protein [Bacillales bacterium]|nr:SufD family Fe-S cluster assembly protein [Bacillales bacterium]